MLPFYLAVSPPSPVQRACWNDRSTIVAPQHDTCPHSLLRVSPCSLSTPVCRARMCTLCACVVRSCVTNLQRSCLCSLHSSSYHRSVIRRHTKMQGTHQYGSSTYYQSCRRGLTSKNRLRTNQPIDNINDCCRDSTARTIYVRERGAHTQRPCRYLTRRPSQTQQK